MFRINLHNYTAGFSNEIHERFGNAFLSGFFSWGQPLYL